MKDEENDDHIFQCKKPTQKQWRSNLIQSLDEKLGDKLDPTLLLIMKQGITSYFNDEQPEDAPRGYWSAPYEELIKQQKAIGWDQF